MAGFFETLGGAAAITGGANVAGGVVSNLINQNFQENEATRNQSNFGITQENFLNNTQIRVADAKKAGIHPLYALGANAPGPTGSQPIVMQDSIGQSLQNAGVGVGSILARTLSAEDRLKAILENKLLDSQIGETDARKNLLQSELAIKNQVGGAGLGVRPEYPLSNAPEGQAPNAPGASGEGMINKKPPDIASGKIGASGFVAGNPKYYQQWEVRPGFYLPIPQSMDEGPEETIQNMSLGAWNGMLNQGQRMYGGAWAREMMDWRYRGIPPKGNYLGVEEHGPRKRSIYGDESKGILRGEMDLRVNKALKGVKKWLQESPKYEPDWLQKQYQKWRR